MLSVLVLLQVEETIMLGGGQMYQKILQSLSPQTTVNRCWTGKCKIIVADDPKAFKLKCCIETDVLYNINSCDSIMIWPFIKEMTNLDKNFYNPAAMLF